MAERGPKEPAHESQEPIESLIDDTIQAILDEAARSRGVQAKTTAPLLDAVLSAKPARGAARRSALERALLAEALADALADALAPALAAALAPRIMDILGHSGGEAGPTRTAPASSTRKSDDK
ncbi:hypothetical protein [Dactylosporangium sp. NPDC000521]|uniref:hypothetical protein n=1 Tax=Dactylosporangium sp. NPDC000521 TaxID=3363975 RepID=UPI0036C22DE7